MISHLEFNPGNWTVGRYVWEFQGMDFVVSVLGS